MTALAVSLEKRARPHSGSLTRKTSGVLHEARGLMRTMGVSKGTGGGWMSSTICRRG